MMEDLAPAEQGDQLQGVTLDQARLVVERGGASCTPRTGATTASTRCRGSRARRPRRASAGDARDWCGPCGRASAPATRTRLEPALDRGRRAAARAASAACARRHDGPRCLTHNDFRPDNMMFATRGRRPAGDGAGLAVLRLWRRAPTDVAYFLAGAPAAGGAPRARGRTARPLPRHGSARTGVAGYGTADLRARTTARGGFQLFLTAFFAAMIVTQTRPRRRHVHADAGQRRRPHVGARRHRLTAGSDRATARRAVESEDLEFLRPAGAAHPGPAPGSKGAPRGRRAAWGQRWGSPSRRRNRRSSGQGQGSSGGSFVGANLRLRPPGRTARFRRTVVLFWQKRVGARCAQPTARRPGRVGANDQKRRDILSPTNRRPGRIRYGQSSLRFSTPPALRGPAPSHVLLGR